MTRVEYQHWVGRSSRPMSRASRCCSRPRPTSTTPRSLPRHHCSTLQPRSETNGIISQSLTRSTVRGSTRRPIHIITLRDSCRLLELLIEANASINERTSNGNTCLHVAAWKGQMPIVQTLLDHGASTAIRNVRFRLSRSVYQETFIECWSRIMLIDCV